MNPKSENYIRNDLHQVFDRLKGLKNKETLIIYDIEYTAWEGSLARQWSGPNEFREIVQIGAVKASRSSQLKEIDSFEEYCLPERNPILSDYFVELTGITQQDLVSHGREFTGVMNDFASFCGDTSVICANGLDYESLMENCLWHNYTLDISPTKFANLRPLFMDFLQARPEETVSSDLPTRFGIPLVPGAHTSIADARSILKCLRIIESHLFPNVEYQNQN